MSGDRHVSGVSGGTRPPKQTRQAAAPPGVKGPLPWGSGEAGPPPGPPPPGVWMLSRGPGRAPAAHHPAWRQEGSAFADSLVPRGLPRPGRAAAPPSRRAPPRPTVPRVLSVTTPAPPRRPPRHLLLFPPHRLLACSLSARPPPPASQRLSKYLSPRSLGGSQPHRTPRSLLPCLPACLPPFPPSLLPPPPSLPSFLSSFLLPPFLSSSLFLSFPPPSLPSSFIHPLKHSILRCVQSCVAPDWTWVPGSPW